MSRIGTLAERLHVYRQLGHVYELVRRWEKARGAYENLLATARKAGDRETEWEALISLAMLGTDYSLDPETDDETFRGVKEKAEQERQESNLMGEGRRAAEETQETYTWSQYYALERAGEALSLAREMGRDDLIAHSLNLSALVSAWAGRWEGMAGKLAEARRLFTALGDRVLEGEALTLYAWAEVFEGRPEEGLRLGRERLSIARETGDRDMYLADSHGLVLALLEVGEYEEALSVAHRGAEAARSLGNPARSMMALLILGDAQKSFFQLDEARATYSETSGTINIPQYRALIHSKLCAVAALKGDWQEASDYALKAAKLRGEVVLQISAPFHFHLEVEALLRGGDEVLAREELRRFVEAVGENPRTRVAYLRALAVLDRWDNETLAAIERLQEAEELAGTFGLPGELWQIRADLGELHEERREHGEARRAFSTAGEILWSLARKLEDAGLREGFLAASRVRRVLDKSAEENL